MDVPTMLAPCSASSGFYALGSTKNQFKRCPVSDLLAMNIVRCPEINENLDLLFCPMTHRKQQNDTLEVDYDS